LILAGVVIAAIMRDLGNTLLVIILGIITVLFSLASGLYLIIEKEASK